MQAKRKRQETRGKLSHHPYKERDNFKLSNIWVYFPRKVTT